MSNSVELHNMVVAYCKELYSFDTMVGGEFITEYFLHVDESSLEELEKEIFMSETSCALMGMGSFKAPSHDGYQFVFYK